MAEKKEWVDFKAVKEAVNIDKVLEHYGLHSIDWAKPSEEERRGKCPFPGSNCKGARSFSINVKRNIFHCFACKARGNILDFVAKMEGCTIRDAALKLAAWFKVEDSGLSAGDPPQAIGEELSRLVAELDTHAEQIAHHASQAEAKIAAIKEIVAAFDKGG